MTWKLCGQAPWWVPDEVGSSASETEPDVSSGYIWPPAEQLTPRGGTYGFRGVIGLFLAEIGLNSGLQ